MRAGTRHLDIDRVRTASYFARRSFDEWQERAERAYADRDRDARAQAHQCRWCFYGRNGAGVLAGQAFTDKACDACGSDQTFSSTHTQAICQPCAARLGLCRQCCGDIDMTRRNVLERK